MLKKFNSFKIINNYKKWSINIEDEKKLFIKKILNNKMKKAPIFILGCNKNSAFISKYICVEGFIDDYFDGNTSWQGLPVIKSKDLPKGSIVINAALHRRPHQAIKRLQKLSNCILVLHYADFIRVSPDRFPLLPFIDEARRFFFKNTDNFEKISDRFIDTISHKVLNDLLLYRITGDPAFTKGYTLREKEQYFDIPFKLLDKPVFIDGGAYEGETTQLFCNRFPNYKRVYLFEPNELSIDLARQHLNEYPNIYFYKYALGAKHEILYFDSESGPASKISSDGKTKVEVVPLDNIIDEYVDYIKLDIEGYEVKALIGAEKIISKFRPMIAVSVYHDIKDFIDVPNTVLNYNNDYCLLLRHYTEGLDETIMYFIDKMY